MTAGPGGAPPLQMAAGWQGARLRAAVDRLHAAQLAALAARGQPAAAVVPVLAAPALAAPALAAPALAPPAPSPKQPAARRDAHDARNEVLARMDEIGSLLTRLGRPERADGEAAALRCRLVKLVVAAAITLAELVGLAFEIESPAD